MKIGKKKKESAPNPPGHNTRTGRAERAHKKANPESKTSTWNETAMASNQQVGEILLVHAKRTLEVRGGRQDALSVTRKIVDDWERKGRLDMLLARASKPEMREWLTQQVLDVWKATHREARVDDTVQAKRRRSPVRHPDIPVKIRRCLEPSMTISRAAEEEADAGNAKTAIAWALMAEAVGAPRPEPKPRHNPAKLTIERYSEKALKIWGQTYQVNAFLKYRVGSLTWNRTLNCYIGPWKCRQTIIERLQSNPEEVELTIGFDERAVAEEAAQRQAAVAEEEAQRQVALRAEAESKAEREAEREAKREAAQEEAMRKAAEARAAQLGRCVICLENASTCAVVPCGHRCCCSTCSQNIRTLRACPICRAKVTNIITVFDA
jgi:hypothetical protein